MKTASLWSLRLGFSGKQSEAISENGLKKFLELSFATKVDTKIPHCLESSPKTLIEHKEYKQKIKNEDSDVAKIELKKQLVKAQELKLWWISKLANEEFPLREKMVLFWHYHYVSTIQ